MTQDRDTTEGHGTRPRDTERFQVFDGRAAVNVHNSFEKALRFARTNLSEHDFVASATNENGSE